MTRVQLPATAPSIQLIQFLLNMKVFKIMKLDKKKIALERMHILVNQAIMNSRTNPQLAQIQASRAKKLSTKHRVKMPYELKISYCKKCKSFIAPGVNSRFRLGRSSLKSIRITCNFCGHIYRKVIAQ